MRDGCRKSGRQTCKYKTKGRSRQITITGAHAPHAGAAEKQKDEFYKTLENSTKDTSNNSNICIRLGDFNARIMERLPSKDSTIGEHIFRNPTDTVEKLSDKQKVNRGKSWIFWHDRKHHPT